MKLLIALALMQTPTAEEIRAMADNVVDYPTKFALVKIGRPALSALLANLDAKNEWIVFESKSAIRWIVNYETDRKAMVEALTPFLGRKVEGPTRAFAAEMLGENGHAGAVEAVADLVQGSTDELRRSALGALKRIPGAEASKALAGLIGKEWATPAVRNEILPVMGARRDPSLTDSLLKAAEVDETREAALAALGESGDLGAVEALAGFARKGHAGAHAALVRLKQGKQAYELATTDEQRIAALSVCDDWFLPDRAMESAALRDAAIAAKMRIIDAKLPLSQHEEFFLKVLTSTASKPLLMRALSRLGQVKTRDATAVAAFLTHEDAAVRQAAVTALRDLPGEGATKALCNAEPTPLVIEALGARGDARAVPALAKLIEKAELRGAAVRALASIGSPEAAGAIEASAKGGDREALEAYEQIAIKAGGPELLVKALEMGGGPRLLEALGRVGDAKSAAVAETFVDRHREAALACMVAIAGRLKKEEAVPVLRRAMELGASGLESKLRALGERVEITARDGKVEHWFVLGPFDAPDVESWSRAEGPEKEVNLATWAPASATGETGVVDLDSFFKKNENVTAYAYAEIVVKKGRDAVLLCGSDDGIIVWVNGEKVNEKLELRGLTADEDKAPVRLKEGANTILVKVCEKGGGWAFHLRLTDDEGRPLKFKVK